MAQSQRHKVSTRGAHDAMRKFEWVVWYGTFQTLRNPKCVEEEAESACHLSNCGKKGRKSNQPNLTRR